MMSEISSPSSDTDVAESASPEALFAESNALKESGNSAFKASDFGRAIEEYEKAVKRAEKVPHDYPDRKKLLSVLHSNLSASYLGLCEHVKAISSASAALECDPENRKAQYRRALARFNAGYLDDARADCAKMVSDDPSNSNARVLLGKVQEKLRHAKEQQRKAFGGIFEKAGGLYDDRAAEMQSRKQRKYADYTREQRDKGETELDFESWERREAEEEAKREAERIEKVKEDEEKKRKEKGGSTEPKRSNGTSSASSSPRKGDAADSDIDEEDRKIIQETKKMGYCYFGKNKPEGNLTHAPVMQKLETETPTAASPSPAGAKCSISSWNSKGTTYEEKDMSQWCKDALRARLSRATYCNDPSQQRPGVNIVEMLQDINIERMDDKSNLEKLQKLAMLIHRSSIKVKSVDDLECDAQIALIRATRRYMFDFSCSLQLELSIDTSVGSGMLEETDSGDSQASVYEGVLKLSEISSEMEKGKSYSDYMTTSFKGSPKPEHVDLLRCMVDQFKATVSECISAFMVDYQRQ